VPWHSEHARSIRANVARLARKRRDLRDERNTALGLHSSRPMHALDVEGELLSVNDRPTIPVPPPRESGVRLRVARRSMPMVAATIDVVVCDLSRDPRSEDYIAAGELDQPQNERPPSTSIVRALK